MAKYTVNENRSLEELNNATTSKDGLMAANDKTKLNGVAANADDVSFTQTITSGTKIGEISINGNSKNIYAPSDPLYIIEKSTSNGNSITIGIKDKANKGYDRNMIWAFGNMNGTPYYGIITTASDTYGENPTAKWTGNFAPPCTYANSGNDRVITITELPSWGTMTLLSLQPIF